MNLGEEDGRENQKATFVVVVSWIISGLPFCFVFCFFMGLCKEKQKKNTSNGVDLKKL